MWLPQKVIAEVHEVARIGYIDHTITQAWNQHRKAGELRALTGWYWTERHGSNYRCGFKTVSMAYSDAWYTLVQRSQVPFVKKPRLRVVNKGVA